jgi:hypothetical protein
MEDKRKYIETDIIRNLYNRGYKWYVLNRNNNNVEGPFDSAEDADEELDKAVDNYLQLLDSKMAENLEYTFQPINIEQDI